MYIDLFYTRGSLIFAFWYLLLKKPSMQQFQYSSIANSILFVADCTGEYDATTDSNFIRSRTRKSCIRIVLNRTIHLMLARNMEVHAQNIWYNALYLSRIIAYQVVHIKLSHMKYCFYTQKKDTHDLTSGDKISKFN